MAARLKVVVDYQGACAHAENELSDMLWRGASDPYGDARASAIVGIKRLAQHGNNPARAEARRLLEAL